MATTDTPTTKRKPAASKRKPATSAKRATRSTARASAARATSTQPATRVERAQQLAGRAVLIPVGAALEARDRVAGAVSDLVGPVRSRTTLERQLTRFERRGGRARTQLEREVRSARRRIEHRGRTLGANVEGIPGRVENVVQNGVEAGRKLVNGAQGRIRNAT
jgi:hypothetical protein